MRELGVATARATIVGERVAIVASLPIDHIDAIVSTAFGRRAIGGAAVSRDRIAVVALFVEWKIGRGTIDERIAARRVDADRSLGKRVAPPTGSAHLTVRLAAASCDVGWVRT